MVSDLKSLFIRNNKKIRVFWSVILFFVLVIARNYLVSDITLIYILFSLYLLGMVSPIFVQPFYIAAFALGIIISNIISTVLLFTLFWLLVVPLGLIMRLFENPLLDIEYRSQKKSYWKTINNPDIIENIHNQY